MDRVVRVGARRVEYRLIQTTRRNLMLKALPEGAIVVYAPKSARLRDVDEFVRGKLDWLDEAHRQIDRHMAEERANNRLSAGKIIYIEGVAHRLVLEKGSARVTIDEDSVTVRCADPNDEDAVRVQLKRALVERALVRFRERLNLYGPKVGKPYGRVTIREQKTRWGSCSSKNNLNFNWKLIMAPSQALDYVVIHELCHLHEFNHSPRFWKLVEAQMPDYKAWQKWLKTHGSELGV